MEAAPAACTCLAMSAAAAPRSSSLPPLVRRSSRSCSAFASSVLSARGAAEARQVVLSTVAVQEKGASARVVSATRACGYVQPSAVRLLPAASPVANALSGRARRPGHAHLGKGSRQDRPTRSERNSRPQTEAATRDQGPSGAAPHASAAITRLRPAGDAASSRRGSIFGFRQGACTRSGLP